MSGFLKMNDYWIDTIDGEVFVDTSDDCEYDYDLIEEYELDDYDEV